MSKEAESNQPLPNEAVSTETEANEATPLMEIPLNTELLRFYDDFVAFHDYCCFMCDALAILTKESGHIDTSTALGASRYCHWIKSQIHNLKADLKTIHESTLKNQGM